MKEKILMFMKDMESNSAEQVVSNWFTEESTVWIPPAVPVNGLSRIKALFRAIFGKHEFVTWSIVDILPVDNNRCIHICTSIGKIKNYGDYTNRVITDIVFDDNGKIKTLSDYFKNTEMFNASKKVVDCPNIVTVNKQVTQLVPQFALSV